MMELLRNAWLGWENYIKHGKLAILLIAVLLYFLFYKKEDMRKSWVRYTAVMTFCCIFPLTATLLMQYQTKFYDYPRIWSLVPVTAMISCGIVSFLWMVWIDGKDKRKTKATGATVLVLIMVLLCGGLGSPALENGDGASVYRIENKSDATKVSRVADKLREICGEDANLCLWAPSEIMEHMRAVDGKIRLPYGRNMWDISLNAYAYDTYSSETVFLYEQMCAWEGAGTGEMAKRTPERIAQTAMNAGVNCILLPKSIDKTTVMKMAEQLKATPQTLEEYWLLYE